MRAGSRSQECIHSIWDHKDFFLRLLESAGLFAIFRQTTVCLDIWTGSSSKNINKLWSFEECVFLFCCFPASWFHPQLPPLFMKQTSVCTIPSWPTNHNLVAWSYLVFCFVVFWSLCFWVHIRAKEMKSAGSCRPSESEINGRMQCGRKPQNKHRTGEIFSLSLWGIVAGSC